MSDLIKVNGTYKIPYVIKAEWTAYLVFSIIFGPIALPFLAIYYKNPDSNTWQGVLIIFSILAVFLIWITFFKIILKHDCIIYKTLFSKGFTVSFSEIKKIEINIGMYASGSGQIYQKKKWLLQI